MKPVIESMEKTKGHPSQMKRSFSLMILGFVVACLMTACKRSPTPPADQDATAVWHNTHARLHTQDLVSLTKTNGQLSNVNDVPTYTFFYEAKVKDVIQLGNSAPGTIETYKSNYPFHWTDKGWMGPDQQIYPVH
jgi:hypothetical protein